MSDAEERERLVNERYGLLFGIRRSVRYHDHRRRHYLRLQSTINFAIIAIGSYGVVSVIQAADGIDWIIPTASGLLAAASLALNPTSKASLHANLCQRFIRLEKRFSAPEARPGNITRSELEAITGERLEIEMDELPIYRAVDRMCHNELVLSEGRRKYLKPLKFRHRALKDFIHFNHLPETETTTV